MNMLRIPRTISVQSLLAAGVAALLSHPAASQAVPEECKGVWARLDAAVKARDLKGAAARERDLAVEPLCNSLSVPAKQLVLGLYRGEAARLEADGARPAERLAVLEAALKYGNTWNVWDIHAKIGDLRRRLPDASGRPDYAGASLAYDRAVRAIDAAPAWAKPTTAETTRLVDLAYQFEAISPIPVPRVGMITRTARQIDVERTPLPLQFVFDSDEMTEAGLAQAEHVLNLLKGEDMPRLHLVGHTDPTGPDDYNDELSLRRAKAVRTFLTERGYPAGRITIEGRGERDVDKLRISDRAEFTIDQIHQMLRRVDLVWK
jgi:outer membrane protein OmpA-like peptidoglycan-associated protein